MKLLGIGDAVVDKELTVHAAANGNKIVSGVVESITNYRSIGPSVIVRYQVETHKGKTEQSDVAYTIQEAEALTVV